MIHYMHLKSQPFSLIKQGKKTIELRLYDEKRKKISVGDQIVFTEACDDSRAITAKVTALHIFDSFDELYSYLPLSKCGYDEENIASASARDMDIYYSRQEQSEYGVVGIEFRLISGTNKRYVKIGHFISYILRHNPGVIGSTLDENGWMKVDELIKGVNNSKKYSLDFETLEKIVKNDSKQRYTFNSGKTLIRANQGHSVDVDVELDELAPPEYLWHGSAEKSADSIERNGLTSQSRKYVHLSPDYETAVNVGSRHGKPIVYRVQAKKMYDSGYKFLLSKNNVWNVESVPVEFLEKQ